jgi:flavin reductase (DIM6/NTAB) family NADH-FMN oxidoreductase RutF
MRDAAAVPVGAYRTLMSCFPTGVAVVTTTDPDGRPKGLTCSSLSSVTLNPPTLLVCVTTTSPVLAAIQRRGSFAANLLHARGRQAASVFSSPVPDRFARIIWRPTVDFGLPWLIEDAFAIAECRLTRSVVVGDHTMVLGEVMAVRHTDDVPLLYGKRRYSAWPESASV